MNSYFRHFLILSLLICISSTALSAGDTTTTRIIVVEGKVICFDVPFEFAKEETILGKFIEKEDEERGWVDIETDIVLCYIPQELRDQILEKLVRDAYVLVIKDIRRSKPTDYTIIAVGTVVKAGYEFSHNIVREATSEVVQAAREIAPAPNISTPTPIPGTVVINKNEQTLAEGEGPVIIQQQTEEQGTVTEAPPSEPTPPPATTTTTTTTTGPTIYYCVNPSNTSTTTFTVSGTTYDVGVGSDNPSDNHDGSNQKPWRSITYALDQISKDPNASSKSTTIYLLPTTHGTGNGESFPINMITGYTLQGVSSASTIIDGTGGGTQGVIQCNSKTGVTITAITITNGNGSTNFGGGITISNSTVTITSCTISNNLQAPWGGGVYIDNSSNVTINSSTVSGNTAVNFGGGIAVNNSSTVTLNTCTISGNNATNINGGGLGIFGTSTAIVNSSTFSGNGASAGTGGGIILGSGTLTVSGGSFTNNRAGRGGAIGIIDPATSASISNATISGNTATIADGGGGIGANSTTATVTITACTIKTSTGNGISASTTTRPSVQGSFFARNDGGGGSTTADHYYESDTGIYYDVGDSGPFGYPHMNTIFGAGSGSLASDPPITGTVYDSVTGETISSPTVAIYDAGTNTQVGSSTTSNPFTFNVDPGSYYIAVSKSGYGFPSQIVASTTSGDHGDIFTAANDALTIDIPMDSDGWLVVEKTCNKERVEIGDIVTYRIKVQNKHWYKSVENVELVDELVNGFKYVGSPSFNLGTISAYSTQTITYQVRVGSAVPPGRYKTNCYTRKSTTGARNSNTDTTEIEVVETPLFTRGTIIGKVFWDFNGNGVQDKGELGVDEVKIYTEYGVCVETDQEGKYHIKDVPAGNHLLKLDTTELPDWLTLTTENPYYVKITEGLLAKVNFGLKATSGNLRQPQATSGNFFIVALGEGIVRNIDTSGNIEMASSGRDNRYDDGVNVDGRLALYLKGKILGKYLIKASIDTDRDQRRLFTNLDPDKYYPVYGDASKVDYSGVDTQDIVWVLIEWDESFAKWGSFHTELPLYNRTLSGGIINYQSVGKTKFGDTRTKIKGFGAFSRQKPAHDEFVGTGGSLYYLRHRDIIEGSEKLRVEVRDRIGKITTNSIPLLEEKDYEIDYDTGRILLKKPLNSIQQGYNNSIISNDILMGERVYLVIDYEYYSGGLSDQSYGINGSQWLGNHIRVGGTYVEEQKTGDPYKLMGGDGTVKINKDTEVNVNYSRTKETQLGSTMSYDGGLTFTEQGSSYSLEKSGSAVSVDGKTKLFNNTDIFLSYSRQDPFYSVSNSISSQGSQKYLGNIITKLTENLSIGLIHLTQKYFEGSIAGETFGATDSYTTTGILDYRPGKWDLRGEYQHQEVKNPITSYTYFGTLPLLDNDFIAARIGYQLFSWLHPYIRGQVTVNGDANDQGTVGTDINIGRNTTLNLAETVGTLGDSTLLGLTTKITEDTDVYANLEVGNHTRLGKYTKTTYGQATQLGPDSKAYIEEDYSSYRENVVRGNVLGYKKKVSGTFSLGLTYERSNIKNNTTAIDRDTGAISLSYLNPDWLKAYSKLEVRNDIGTSEIRQWVTENDILWRTTEWLTLTGRGNWGWTANEDTNTDEAEFYEVGAGFSLRPVTWDKLNILGKYSYLTDFPPDSPPMAEDFALDIESIKHVYSIEGIYDLFKYLSLVGKFSYRDMEEKVGTYDWVDSDTYLYIARTNFHIMNSEPNKPFLLRGWDFAVEYRTLTNDQIEDEKEGFLVELDKDLGQYIRCGVGYNFTDYDDDLQNDDNWDAKGWFFKLAGKY